MESNYHRGKTAIKRKGIVKRREATERKPAPNISNIDATYEQMERIYRIEGYRERTINDYRKYYAEFTRFAGKATVQDITTDDFRAYIDDIVTVRGLSKVTANVRLSCLRAFFNRMVIEGIIPSNPVDPLRKLRTDESRIFTLTDSQIKRLFSVIDTSTFPGFRDYVALMTALTSGLRSNELNSLEKNDVNLSDMVILLPGAKNKNRKSRVAPFNKKLHDLLEQLTAEVEDYFGEVTHVFTNQFGEPLQNDLLRKRVDKYAQMAGLKGECRASLHSLRHTFAVNFLKRGGDVRALQAILGHTSLSTTQVYLQYSDRDVIEKYGKVDMDYDV
jgi:site-specific recombinase XerD